jgi:hypothetical protein
MNRNPHLTNPHPPDPSLQLVPGDGHYDISHTLGREVYIRTLMDWLSLSANRAH